jgi:adenosylmethionine-8-amino-7-oxononanoate aminotransferase
MDRQQERWLRLDRHHIWHPFTGSGGPSAPLLIASGQGAVLRTNDGREIIDGISSWWVNLFGHAHPQIASAVARQAQLLEQVIFAGFTHEPAIQLAERLAALLPEDLNRVFFSDNGSTSVEVALKLAWQYWQNVGQSRRQRIMAFEGGYHGDTLGAMSAGVSSGFFDAWQRQLLPCEVMPYPATWQGDCEVDTREAAALAAIDGFLEQQGDEVAAMILEPLVQGASGMRIARATFVAAVVQRLRDHGVLVIFDEVMTGFGRTGSRFALEQVGVAPDMICLSKGLTGGFLPMSVTVVKDRIFESFQGGPSAAMFCHGHSYTANPLGCAAALASLDLLGQPETSIAWQQIESAHRAGLQAIQSEVAGVRCRVLGTIAAVELPASDPGYQSATGRRIAAWFRQRHQQPQSVLVRPLGNVVYLLPPYCIDDQQLEFAWQEILRAVQEAG